MTRLLNHSDIKLIRSVTDGKRFLLVSTPTPTPAREDAAANRADRARLSHGNLQALWPGRLSLRRWARTRTQAIFVDDRPNRRTPAPRLCAERDLPKGRRVSWQLPHATGDAQRDLRDQCRSFCATARVSTKWIRLLQPSISPRRRHHRQHDRILSCCRRHAAQCGRSRAC